MIHAIYCILYIEFCNFNTLTKDINLSWACFTGGAKQNKRHELDLIEKYFNKYWMHDLLCLRPLVRSMLAFSADTRPKVMTTQLQQLFPGVTGKVTEWLEKETTNEGNRMEVGGKPEIDDDQEEVEIDWNS